MQEITFHMSNSAIIAMIDETRNKDNNENFANLSSVMARCWYYDS